MAEFRGVLHVHSTLSDGALSLEEICDWALQEHLDFVCVTDHSAAVRGERVRQLCDDCLRLSGDVLLVPGIEFEHRGRHVVVIAPAAVLQGISDQIAVDDPAAVRRVGGMTIWAHPSLTFSVSLRDAIAADYDGWEVWNRRADGRTPSVPMLRLLRRLSGNRALLPHAGLDLHAPPVVPMPVYTIRSGAAHLTAGHLLEALRHGDYVIANSHGPLTITPGEPESAVGIGTVVTSWLRHVAIRARCIMAVLKHRALSPSEIR